MVFRADGFYVPPQSLPPDAWDMVPVAERAIRWFEYQAQRGVPRTEVVLLGEDRWARIDGGRWVASCPCGSAQVVSPEDPRLFCVECLTGWYTVLFPADPAGIEQLVAGLPEADQFWWDPRDPNASPPPAEPLPAVVEPSEGVA